MANSRAAIRYAKAILDIADSKKVADKVSSDMSLIASTINSNTELNTFILSPTIKIEVKEKALLEYSDYEENIEEANIRDIDGLCYREGGKIHYNGKYCIIKDLGALPSPYTNEMLSLMGSNKIIY